MDEGEAYEDLRTACIHEAGHAIVARRYGLAVDAFVEINEGWRPGQRRYRGSVCLLHKLETELEHADQRQALLLAGVAAEALAADPNCAAEHLCDCIDRGTIPLSQTDAAAGYSAAAFDQCLALLRAEWQEVEDLADRLEQTPGGYRVEVGPK